MPMRSVSPECWWRPRKKCVGDIAAETGELEFCAQWQVYIFNVHVWVHVFVKLGDLRPRPCQKASVLSLSYWEARRIPKQLIPQFCPFLSHGRTTKSWKNWSWASITHRGSHDIGTNCVPRDKKYLGITIRMSSAPHRSVYLNTGSHAGGTVLWCCRTLEVQDLVGKCGSLGTGLGLCGSTLLLSKLYFLVRATWEQSETETHRMQVQWSRQISGTYATK